MPEQRHNHRRDSEGLTPREAAFVAEYCASRRAVDSAIKAGYSPKMADRNSGKILARPSVKAAIERRQAAHVEAVGIRAERVLEELRRVATVDPRALFDSTGALRRVVDLPAEVAAAIASIEVVQRVGADGQPVTVTKVRLWDKNRAAEILARHLGLLTERIEVRGESELIERLAAARLRLATAVH